MDFDKTKWRITRVNVGQKFCQTYPELLIVQGKLSDDQLLKITNFRSSKRFSAVVWKSKINDDLKVKKNSKYNEFFLIILIAE